MKRRKSAKAWEKTRRQNLWRHRSGTYYARRFSAGKQIWRSLKTPLFSVAEPRDGAGQGRVTLRRMNRAPAPSIAVLSRTVIVSVPPLTVRESCVVNPFVGTSPVAV